MNNRITPIWIKSLKPDQIFVFGSNVQGVHGKGAAKQALMWGAKSGKGFGLKGQTYAIPTREVINKSPFKLRTLPLKKIAEFVDGFIADTKINPEKNFLVTEIGCGLAGLSHEDIAPMFAECMQLENVWLPAKFREIIGES